MNGFALVRSAQADTVYFYMVDDTDHATPKTGLSPSGNIKFLGTGSFPAVSGAIAEVGGGWYSYQFDAAETDGGPIALTFTATGADAAFVSAFALKFDWAQSHNLGLTALPAIQSGLAGSVLTALSPLAEGYPTLGTPGTLQDMVYAIYACVAQYEVAGAVLTAWQLDGVTPAMTFSLDSATTPTSRTRAT